MDKVKVAVTAVFSAILGWLGILAVPVMMLVLCNVIDYGTGLAAAKYREQAVSSYRSFKGIVKKVCQWLIIVVGWVIDQLIAYTTSTMGWDIHLPYIVATVVAVWLICNEIISILENMIDIGARVPPFLLPLVKLIKTQAEEKAGYEPEQEVKGNE